MAELTTFPQYFSGNTDKVYDTKEHPLGSRAQDVNGNEYIFLQGVASTVAGDFVTFDEAHLTTRAIANAQGRVAVAMAAVVANKYGWYQIYGNATGNVLAGFADNGKVYLTATAGSVDDADVAGDAVVGAVGRSAIDGNNQAVFELNYPFVHDVAID